MPQTTRRMAFHAHATGFGGIIGKEFGKPADRLLDTLGSSALAGSGGRHVGEISGKSIPQDLQRWVGFDRIVTRVEGRFTDPGAAFDLTTNKELDQSRYQTATTAEVIIENLTVLDRFKVGYLAVRLDGNQPSLEGSSGFRFRETVYKDVTFDGKPVEIELSKEMLSCDTLDAIDASAKDCGSLIFEPRPATRLETIGKDLKEVFTRAPHRDHDGGVLYTFVKKVTWDGKTDREHPNRMVVPEFGHIVFGEVRAKKHARRVSMIRFLLGSGEGLMADAGTIDENGSWVP